MKHILRFMVFIFLVLGIYAVQRVYVMKIGYEIGDLKKEKRHLEQIHNSLLIERAALTSMERIEKIATSYLEMKNPEDNQIVLVKVGDYGNNANTLARADTGDNNSISQIKMVKYQGRKQ